MRDGLEFDYAPEEGGVPPAGHARGIPGTVASTARTGGWRETTSGPSGPTEGQSILGCPGLDLVRLGKSLKEQYPALTAWRAAVVEAFRD